MEEKLKLYTKNSYEYIKINGKRKLYHIHVVEQFLCYELKKGWVVHHIDLNKSNNSINNLMIFKSQKEHMSFHIYFTKYGFNQRVRRMIRDRWKEFRNI